MKKRKLTSGEIALATSIFGKSIDYDKVHIHNHGYVFFQPKHSGMTPKGNLYMKGKRAQSKDYSLEPEATKGFFIHEMVHVWQHQLKVLNPTCAAIKENFRHWFNYLKAYKYTLEEKKDLLEYRIEQQASIIQEYYYLRVANKPGLIEEVSNPLNEIMSKQLFQKVLAKFLLNPSYPKK